jgi:hypothetical protein
MAISTKVITMRQGNKADYQPSKMLSGELAVINDSEELHFSPKTGKSIRVATEKDVEELNDKIKNSNSGVNEDVIKDAVNDFLEQNPPSGGATAEQIAQIEKNTQDIGELSGQISDKEASGTAQARVTEHNTSETSHSDIRLLIEELATRLNALADSDDTTLDQMSEIVAYIKSNKSLIDSITTGKVSVSDIIDNLTTSVSNKPLSAKQGVQLKALIDAIVVPTKTSQLTDDVGFAKQTEVDALSGQISDQQTEINNKQPKGNYALKSEIPTKTSQLQNDSGFVTEGELGSLEDKVESDAYKESVAQKVPYVKVAEHPICVNSIAEMTDISKMYVLNSDGMFYSYKRKEVTTEGSKTPNFTNVMDNPDAYIKTKSRYSHSGGAFKPCETDDAIVIPIASGSHTIRIRGAENTGSYISSHYYGANNQTFSLTGPDVTRTVESNGDIKIVVTVPSSASYMVIHVGVGVDVDELIVTIDQEITYTTVEGETEITYEWSSTGISYNQPADYEPRVIAVENKTKTLESKTSVLSDRLDSLSIDSSSSESIVFSLPAFAPTPQKAPTADGGGLMDVRAIRTNTYYEYMDELVAKHPNYLYKQYMGKDMSNTYDHYRYIACRSYYHAWQKENYPKLFAWINGNTIVYSLSVSPRVGDTMYSTPYVGTSYGTVSVVNCNFDPVKASTRTVNGLEFERYSTGDIEPTVVFTTVKREYAGCTVYNSSFANSTTVSVIENGVMTCADGNKYTRYPFEDRRNDKSKPLSIFILSNEHAGCNWGDSSIVSIIVAQFLTDMCENKNIPFLRWLKDNCMITTIPIGNPWGYSEDSIDGYNNANGVNINRNYDTPGWCLGEYDLGGGHGEYAGSESETQHIMNTIHLCNADVGMSMHGVGHHNETPTQDGYAQMQGQGFDHSIRRRLEEILTTSYNLGLEADITDYNDPYHTGKSPSYIQYAGAVGGLTETVPWNALTGEYFDSVAMEAGYTEMLLFLQCWIKEAIEKMS